MTADHSIKWLLVHSFRGCLNMVCASDSTNADCCSSLWPGVCVPVEELQGVQHSVHQSELAAETHADPQRRQALQGNITHLQLPHQVNVPPPTNCPFSCSVWLVAAMPLLPHRGGWHATSPPTLVPKVLPKHPVRAKWRRNLHPRLVWSRGGNSGTNIDAHCVWVIHTHDYEFSLIADISQSHSEILHLFPARPHDFFDAQTMEAIRHRAICLNLATHIESQGNGHSVVFHSTVSSLSVSEQDTTAGTHLCSLLVSRW